MNVVAKGTILKYIDKYPEAKTALLIWYKEIAQSDFKNFNELKAVYGNASLIANSRVVFNIKGNDYRLVVAMNFLHNATYVIWFGTHKEYDKIDVTKILFKK